MTTVSVARRSLILAMLIFGTIGIFRKFIPLASGPLAMLRGFTGTIFLIVLVKLRRQKLDRNAISRAWLWLVISGALIGLNWILLFEAYRFTSVAVATLCYYMAPVIVILVAPLVLGETLTAPRLACCGAAFLGMILVSGIFRVGGMTGAWKGIALGLGAACLYAGVILMNKKMPAVPAYDKTIVQLFSAAAVLLPYNLLSGEPMLPASIPETILVAVVGIVHTGIAYWLYFGSMGALSAQTIALCSYIDPVAAIVLSLLIFREPMGLAEVLGALLILGATLVSELLPQKSPAT